MGGVVLLGHNAKIIDVETLKHSMYFVSYCIYVKESEGALRGFSYVESLDGCV